MATLVHRTSGARHVLGSAHLVGRSRNCQLRLRSGSVSGEHASLRWVGSGWQVRDLGSRNGTWVEGERLPPGVPVALLAGMRVAFGQVDDPWEVEDAAPPEPRARCGDRLVIGEDGLLALPDEVSALAVVHGGALGTWVLDTGDEPRVVRDGEAIPVGDDTWTLELPERLDDTRTQDLSGRVTLEVRVSSDEEHVELELVRGEHRAEIGHRSFSELLLALARARVRDAALPEAERGWVYADELAGRLGLTRTRFNMAVYRARQAFERTGLGVEPVERRRGSGQVRLGVAEPRIGGFDR